MKLIFDYNLNGIDPVEFELRKKSPFRSIALRGQQIGTIKAVQL